MAKGVNIPYALGIDNLEPLGDKLVANISLPDDDSLVNKILSYGGNVRVAEPSASL